MSMLIFTSINLLIFPPPQRIVHELPPETLLRILLVEFFLRKAKTICGNIVEYHTVCSVHLPDCFLVVCAAGIRMVTLHQLPMAGLDRLEGGPPRPRTWSASCKSAYLMA
jgi:hypothetical protein